MIELSLVIPTLNEADNIEPLLARIDRALTGLAWEVVFVDDDSTDGTVSTLRAIATRDPRVRCIQRIGRRGLSSAVVEGILSTTAPAVGVMDADLQHDERALPRMLSRLSSHDVVVATRYGTGASTGDWMAERARLSKIGTRVAQSVLRVQTTDPMSGFFLLRREVFDQSVRRLSVQGYKILLDVLASHPGPLRIAEVPYEFGVRVAGDSKLDTLVMWEFFTLLLDKRFGRWLPPRLMMFLLVGGSGVLVHYAALLLLLGGLGAAFPVGQTMATLLSMPSNSTLNNVLTYRDRRRRGWRWVTGLLSYCAACGLGILANVGVASSLFQQQGWALAAAAGILVGTVWNFVATRALTWGRG